MSVTEFFWTAVFIAGCMFLGIQIVKGMFRR